MSARPVDSLGARLSALYPDDVPALRITDAGLWHPTPLDVLASAMPVLLGAGLVRAGATVFDAGAGDGRVLAALALGLPPSLGARVAGLEADAALAADAARRLALVPPASRPAVACGDYLEANHLRRVGLAPEDLDVVFNYPDGNERALLGWLAANAPSALLVVLSPERDPDLGASPALRVEVPRDGAPPWHVSVFRPS